MWFPTEVWDKTRRIIIMHTRNPLADSQHARINCPRRRKGHTYIGNIPLFEKCVLGELVKDFTKDFTYRYICTDCLFFKDALSSSCSIKESDTQNIRSPKQLIRETPALESKVAELEQEVEEAEELSSMISNLESDVARLRQQKRCSKLTGTPRLQKRKAQLGQIMKGGLLFATPRSQFSTSRTRS